LTLAHHIKFDDNELMINKIKGFLKNKLSRGRSSDLSDQDEEIGEEELLESESSAPAREDRTGDFHLDDDQLPQNSGWKDRLTATFSFHGLKEKMQALKHKEKSLKSASPSRTAKSAAETSAPTFSPSLGQNLEKVLARESREPLQQISLVLLISVTTYSLGKVVALSLRKPTFESAREYTVSLPMDKDFNPQTLNQIKGQDPFKTKSGATKKKVIADTKCDKAQQASSLPIKLVNTVVLQDSIKSLAAVQVRGDRDLQQVREGEQISNLAKIFKIDRLEILVKNLENGVCESIASDKAREARSPISVMSPQASREYKLNKKMPGIENVGNKFNISKDLLNQKMKDIASILTQARALKMQNPDGTLSFKMTEIDPEGIFPYLGIQDGDIITSINGKPIYDINEVMSLFGKIKNLDNLSLGVKREGSDSNLEYSIKK
jgi:type II secretory pathway component PulC